MKLIKPRRLKKGDTIGVVSLASSLPADIPRRFQKGIDSIKNLGYKVKIGKFVSSKLGYMAGSPESRAEDLNNMFLDEDVAVIISSIGGYNSNQLLNLIDYEKIKKNPKIIVGYSDITAVLLAIYARTGLVTFHGPSVMTQFADNPHIMEYTLVNMQKILSQSDTEIKLHPSKEWTDEYLDWSKNLDIRPRKMNKSLGWKVLKEGKAEGRLVGGNLQTIQTLIGTKYLPSFKRCIFFWEETESSTAQIDRTLQHFRDVGILEKIKGMIIGRLDRDVKISSPDYGIEDIVSRVCKEYDFPIITEMDFGHTDPILTLPIGVRASFDTSLQELKIRESAVI